MPTPLLLETIKIENAEVLNLSYHQQRCDLSRNTLFNTQEALDLSAFIYPPPVGLWRCRILYDTQIKSIEYIPYRPKNIKRIKIVSSSVEYALKYADRTCLTSLLDAHPEFDEILIEKDGYLTDTTISNIAFYDGSKWVTPSNPLLKGCMRAKLIDEGFLETRPIRTKDLETYTQVALMNAMIGFRISKKMQIQDIQGNIYDY